MAMLYMYKELKQKGLTNYKIKKMLDSKQLYKLECGLYSETLINSKLEIVIKMHKDCVITLLSAFYCYGLIKEEPTYVYLATYQNARKILDINVRQTFMTTKLYRLGVNKMTYKGILLDIYSLERLLIELVRNKINIDYDIYKEVCASYKKLGKLLNKNKLREYLNYFKDKKIVYRIKEDVGLEV